MPAPSVAHPTKLADEVTRHAVQSVNDCHASDDPFPHFTTLALFPEGFYRELVDALPGDELCTPIGANSSVDGDAACRLRWGTHEDSLALLDADAARLWRAAREALASEAFRRAVYTKLAGGLALRCGCRPEEVLDKAPGFALPELYRETRGYRITPHPDTRKKVVTMQVSLARDASQEHLGTEFYRRNLAPAAWRSEPRGFDIVKTVPFLPNAASAFVVLNKIGLKSWHGRTALSEQNGVRNSILNIWYAKAEATHRSGAGTPASYAA
ncbi:hypothetical protein [Botrimarina sp.]|uniref:hypothetical protein n=1 Tax=Botrimarina sp. TaxID=2795802 RepID=UPI0032EF1A4A